MSNITHTRTHTHTHKNLSWIKTNFCPLVLCSVLQNLPNLNVITILPIPLGIVIFPGLYSCFEISTPPFPTHTLQRIFSFYILRSDCLFVPDNTSARTLVDLKLADIEKNGIWLVVCVVMQFRTNDCCTQLSKHSDFDLTSCGYFVQRNDPAFGFRPRECLSWTWRFWCISVPEDKGGAVVNTSKLRDIFPNCSFINFCHFYFV